MAIVLRAPPGGGHAAAQAVDEDLEELVQLYVT